ncbi:PREDICTED: multicystatin-like isoform X2 [Ipomoea nil]|uniref:multicystatin-like isoform X2 n=1 Tax=Ipomoea nil TaxID=35883 RepID=UPI000900D68D|nr:PREDICTED: multicystatin-like isoform X2 [Ipomoea nil]
MASIEELARFAVAEQNKKAVIYDITVVAADHGGQKKVYEAKVAVNESQNTKELKEFKLVGNEASKPAAGGISSVSL